MTFHIFACGACVGGGTAAEPIEWKCDFFDTASYDADWTDLKKLSKICTSLNLYQ